MDEQRSCEGAQTGEADLGEISDKFTGGFSSKEAMEECLSRNDRLADL